VTVRVGKDTKLHAMTQDGAASSPATTKSSSASPTALPTSGVLMNSAPIDTHAEWLGVGIYTVRDGRIARAISRLISPRPVALKH